MTLVDAHLGRGLTRGPLALVPVFAGRGTHDPGYVLAPDVVQVGEVAGAAEVGRLTVINPGDRPALVLEGDLLLGGQQDRVAGRSAVVGAHRSLDLDVYCSEAGRWDASSRTHRPTGGRAPAEVRAALTADQGEVWRRVDRYGQRFGAGPTSALRDATGNGEAAAGALVDGLQPLFGQCGVLVGVGGQPLLVEVVESPEVFARLWGPLLASVALDAVGAPAVPLPGRRARRFLDRVLTAPGTSSTPAGEARAVYARSPYADVRALTWRSRSVWMSALNVRHPLLAA